MRSPRIEMTFPSGNDEVVVDAGGAVTLRCSGMTYNHKEVGKSHILYQKPFSALGDPKPTITWKRLDAQPLRIVTRDGSTKKGLTLIFKDINILR